MGANEIAQMGTIDQTRTMELLWDSLCQKKKELPSPEWHGELIQKRVDDLAVGRAKTIPLNALKKHAEQR